ncbi:MAG TPA: glutamate racemase [Dissulfurispiraceae bacterium]|nr:glutamate racemase [Dissulfurispiraceae bacterium]
MRRFGIDLLMPNNNPIGIFDSGIGGLTVFKEVSRMLPFEDIIYLGDTARVPYGIRSAETVARYSFECADFLMGKRIKVLVVACNTVSAISLNEIRERVPVPVIGVIEPGAKAAVSATETGRVGVIGTEATIRSGAYSRAIKAIDASVEVYGLACPLFVPLVEEGWTDGEIAKLVAERYLSGLRTFEIDTIVLGCTHYPLLKGVIQDVMQDIKIIDSAVETGKVLKAVLEEGPLLRESGESAVHKFYVTDSTEKFTSVGERFLGSKISEIERVMF